MMFDVLHITQKIGDTTQTKEEAAQSRPNTVTHPEIQSIVSIKGKRWTY
jgi:hypothetical protein